MTFNTHTGTMRWKHKVRLGDLWHNEELPFEEKRDRIVRRFRTNPAMQDGETGEELGYLVDELSEVDDPDDFDWVMGAIYDLADGGKWLWIDTIEKHP